MDDGTRPLLARLSAVLAGEADMSIRRPPVPKYNPRHDLYGYHEERSADVKEMLGEEYFSGPVQEEKPAPSKQLYTIGQLGKVINRTPPAIRQWIRAGVIPEADHWTQGEQGELKTMPDGTIARTGTRKRLYTHAQVMGLLALASEAGMVKNRTKGIKGTNFVAGAWKLWEECADDERALS